MKKWKFRSLVCLGLCLSMLLTSFSVRGESDTAGDAPEIQAQAAVVMEIDTGNTVYTKDMNTARPPGGLAKVMTVLLLVENYDLTQRVAFSEIMYERQEGSRSLGLQPGEEISLYDAACAVMLGSANDVANGIAEYIAGSPEAFAVQMNERAAELGCVNTHFSNPNGTYSEDQYSCAYDLALIAGAAYQNEVFREICGLAEYTISPTNLNENPRQLQNSHQMTQSGSGFYRDWCMGGKDSYTSQSQNDMMTYGRIGDKNLVSVVLGVNDAGEAYMESGQLLAYGYNSLVGGGEETEEELLEGMIVDMLPVEADSGEETLQTEEGIVYELTPETEADGILQHLLGYLDEGNQLLSDYTKDHFAVVFVGWCIFLLILLTVIILLILRCSANFKLRRKRRRAEKMCRQREAQIESMTIEELEEELRKRNEAEGRSTSEEDSGGAGRR